LEEAVAGVEVAQHPQAVPVGEAARVEHAVFVEGDLGRPLHPANAQIPVARPGLAILVGIGTAPAQREGQRQDGQDPQPCTLHVVPRGESMISTPIAANSSRIRSASAQFFSERAFARASIFASTSAGSIPFWAQSRSRCRTSHSVGSWRKTPRTSPARRTS